MSKGGTFTALATPRMDASRVTSQLQTPSCILVLCGAVLLAMAGFVFGNVATWAPLYELQLVNTMSRWWRGYPKQHHSAAHTGVAHNILDTGVGRNITVTGHTEMIRPTFLLIFCIAPFAASVLLLELLRFAAPTRRSASVALSRAAVWLRRKPQLPVLGVSRLSLGEWLFGVVFVLGGNALCFYYEWDRRIAMARAAVAAGTGKLDTTKYFNIVGISSAYLCIYNMAFLLLPVTRNSTWLEFFNISYANGVRLHRWVGYATVVTAVAHTAGYWGKWIREGTFTKHQTPCFDCDIGSDGPGGGYDAWFNFFGLLSVLALLLMIPTSLPVVRRRCYEAFYVSHWTLFVVAVVFAILHWAQIIWWLLPSGLLFFVSRAVSSWNGLAPVRVQRFELVHSAGTDTDTNTDIDTTDTLVRIVVERAAAGSSPAAPAFDYQVGNFVYLNVPHISTLEWHALTIASSPQTSATDVTLLVKPLGDWSRQLAAYAAQCNATSTSTPTPMPVVYLDGYYGASLALYDAYPTLCLVGGGIGVTPLLAVLEDVAASVAKRSGRWTQRVVLVLTCRELALLHVLAPVLMTLRELDPLQQHFTARLFLTRAPTDVALDAKLTLDTDPQHGTAATKDKDPRGLTAVDNGGSSVGIKRSVVPAAAPRAFYEPLRSSTALRVTLFALLFVATSVAVAAARWGNGALQGDDHPEIWPLERAFELAVFCASIVLAYAVIWFEWTTFERSSAVAARSDTTGDTNTDRDASLVDQTTGAFALSRRSAALAADVHCVRDLLQHLDVVVGERPDMHALLHETLTAHDTDCASGSNDAHNTTAELPVVGVLVSGPECLKVATNDAVVALGRSRFDVHEEEFEL